MSEVKESNIIRFLSYATPILLVAYVLSIGPVAAFILDSDGDIERPEYVDLVVSFYAPLEWAGEKK